MSAVAYRLPHSPRVPHLELLPSIDQGTDARALVYRRRRLLAAAIALVLAAVLAWAASGVVAGAEPASASAPVAAAPAGGGVTVHTVRSGDTLWSIASRARPGVDPRPLVTDLSRARNGAPLQVGEKVLIPR